MSQCNIEKDQSWGTHAKFQNIKQDNQTFVVMA
jgi:hypothetical protein